MKVLVTGGAGFIGSAVILKLIRETTVEVVNLDLLTYAGNLASLAEVADNPRYTLERQDVRDPVAMATLFARHQPALVMHLAAESHVDRSIDGPADFIQTNIVGTYTLLEAARAHWDALTGPAKGAFRFHHISTDEVYGSLGATGLFTEATPYDPSSPYSASKAASDHLVRAWQRTYGLPTLISNCSNNYGPRQFPEKLIPLMILKGMRGERLPVYGSGANVRDWLHVEDHADALWAIASRGVPGETYNVGGNSEQRNLTVVETLCDLLDEALGRLPGGAPRRQLITFVTDRPGHDHRYAIDATKIARELGWTPRHTFASGLRETVAWYLNHEAWWRPILEGAYQGERLGLTP